MSKRITKADVHKAFESFLSAARKVGFDTTDWWIKSPDVQGEVWRLFRVYQEDGIRKAHGSTPFPVHLEANTPREAYYRIQAWTQALNAVRDNNEL